MNLKELKESLNEAKDAKKALLSKAVEEVRSLDGAEDDELRLLDEKISNLQKQIKEAEEEIRNNSIETKITNKGEMKNMKTKEELRSEFLQALATPNKEVGKMQVVPEEEVRAAGDGYVEGKTVLPAGASDKTDANKGAMSVPLTIEAAIRQAVDFNSNVLGYCNVVRTNGVHRIVLDASPASEARLVKEGAAIGTVDSEFKKVELNAFKYAEIVKFTREVVEDVNFNIVAHAGQRLGMAFAKAFEKAIILGTGGADQPEGLLNATPDNTDLQKASQQVTAAKGVIAANDVVAAYYNLPHQFRQGAIFVVHPNTVKALAMLQDGEGRQLLTNGLVPFERQLMGVPVVECAYMPQLGTAGAKVGMFVNAREALTVSMRTDYSVRQLHELYAANDLVALIAVARFDSRIVMPGAISYIVTGAAETPAK